MILKSFQKFSISLLKKRHYKFGIMAFGEKLEHDQSDDKYYRITTKTNYFVDPEEVTYKVCSLIMLHDCVKKKDIKLTDTWNDLGIDPLSKMEILIMLEQEFDIGFHEKDQERFKNIYDIVQNVSKNMFTSHQLNLILNIIYELKVQNCGVWRIIQSTKFCAPLNSQICT